MKKVKTNISRCIFTHFTEGPFYIKQIFFINNSTYQMRSSSWNNDLKRFLIKKKKEKDDDFFKDYSSFNITRKNENSYFIYIPE